MVSGLLKWLIFTNLYIALASACFQGVFALRGGLAADWNWALTVHTFFSTWLVYQFSRFHFHRNVHKSKAKIDELYHWQDEHPNFTLHSSLVAGAVTLATLFFLRWQTWLVLAALGVISMLYPVDIKAHGRNLRSIPFIKIFLIGVVWAGMAVWVPLAEAGLPLVQGNGHFLWYLFFILFITLPFDMVDIPTDTGMSVKTIPAAIGWRPTQYLVLILGVLLIAWEAQRLLLAADYGTALWLAETALILGLVVRTFTLPHDMAKWKVMAWYDGSMVALFCLTFVCYG